LCWYELDEAFAGIVHDVDNDTFAVVIVGGIEDNDDDVDKDALPLVTT
jgi:hypothetical protein